MKNVQAASWCLEAGRVEDPHYVPLGFGRCGDTAAVPQTGMGAALLLLGSAQPPSCSPLGPWYLHPGGGHLATSQMAPAEAGA